MNKEKGWLLKELEEHIIAVGIIIMFVMETVNVIFRFLIPSWAGVPAELSIFAYIWVCFFCASYCTKRGTNIVVDALTAKYPEKIKKFLFSAQYVVDAILSLLFISGAIPFVIHTKEAGSVGVTKIPLWIIYLAPLAGFGLNFVRDIQMFLKAINTKDKVAV